MRLHQAVQVAALLVASLEARPVRAEESLAPTPQTETRYHYYGWQGLLVDTAGIIVLWEAMDEPNTPYGGSDRQLLAVGIALGTPTIHLLHRHPVRGLMSLAARALPASLIIRCYTCNEGIPAGMIFGGVVGLAVVSLIDDAAASWDVETVPTTGARIQPVAAFTPHGELTVGVVGTW
jgi:hypothetical protein